MAVYSHQSWAGVGRFMTHVAHQFIVFQALAAMGGSCHRWVYLSGHQTAVRNSIHNPFLTIYLLCMFYTQLEGGSRPVSLFSWSQELGIKSTTHQRASSPLAWFSERDQPKEIVKREGEQDCGCRSSQAQVQDNLQGSEGKSNPKHKSKAKSNNQQRNPWGAAVDRKGNIPHHFTQQTGTRKHPVLPQHTTIWVVTKQPSEIEIIYTCMYWNHRHTHFLYIEILYGKHELVCTILCRRIWISLERGDER